jgi:alpha-glucosidase
MKKVLKNLLSVTVEPDLNEYHFKSIDGTLEISIKAINIIHFNYIFNDIPVKAEALYGSDFISENYRANKSFNLVEDAPLREEMDCFVITIKSALKIKIDKSSALLSIYKNNILIHGRKIGNDSSSISSNQLKVLKAKGDESFESTFMFEFEKDDELYGVSDKIIQLDNKKNSIIQDYSSTSNAFFVKRKKSGNVCGIFFDQCSIDEMIFGVLSPLYYSITSHDSPSSYYFLDGSNYNDIIRAYYDVIGRPSFPPLFTFGYLGSFMDSMDEGDSVVRILKFFNKIEEYKIPCEGIYVTSRYLKESGDTQYPLLCSLNKPNQSNDYKNDSSKRGYHLSLKIEPGMLTNHDKYEELDKKGYFIKDEFGNSYVFSTRFKEVSYIDFTNIDAYNWWKLQLKEQFIINKCSGIWFDKNEFEIEDPGVSLKKIKSILSLKMSNAINDALDEASEIAVKKRHWVVSRVNNHKHQLLQNKKNYPKKTLTSEMLLRSIESEVLNTSLEINSLFESSKDDCMSYLEVLPLLVDLIKMHYAFMPYIYNAAYEAHTKGLPLDRLLCMEFKDERVDSNSKDRLFGGSIIKVLVQEEGVTQREVYLPKDTHWYNAANKKFYYGGANVAVDASPGTFNYFVKEGSIIELNRDNDKKLTTGLFKNLDLRIYRIKDDKSSLSQYFEDDGQTHLDENKFNIYEFELTKRRLIITKIKCSIKNHGRLFNFCNETGNRIASFDPDKLEEGESISYKL